MLDLIIGAERKKVIRYLQNSVLPKLKTQLAETTGFFKEKEGKALTEQIQQTEKEISEGLNKLPNILKEEENCRYGVTRNWRRTYWTIKVKNRIIEHSKAKHPARANSSKSMHSILYASHISDILGTFVLLVRTSSVTTLQFSCFANAITNRTSEFFLLPPSTNPQCEENHLRYYYFIIIFSF